MSASTLTEEQKATIARNKARCLELARQRMEREKAAPSNQSTDVKQSTVLTQTIVQTQAAVADPTQVVIPTQTAIPPQTKIAPHVATPKPNVITGQSIQHVPSKTTLTIPASRPPVVNPSTSNPVLTVANKDVTLNMNYPIFNKDTNKQRSAPVSSTSKTKVSGPMYRPPTIVATRSLVNISFKFSNANRIKVVFQPYHDCIRDAIKTVSSRVYNDMERFWSIALEDYDKLISKLNTVKLVDVKIQPIPYATIKMLTDFKPEPVPNDLSIAIDPNLIKALFPYQKEGTKFGIAMNGRCLVADEMGLGKSIQALAIARFYKGEWPLMIVCPSSVKAAWKNQLNTFMPYIKNIFCIEKNTDALPDSRTSNTVVILSYDLMALKLKELENKKYDVIIWDESHMLKDGKSKRTKAATSLSKKASRVILLSGTPALSRPAELFSQIRLVNDKLFPNFQHFAIRYCDGKQGRFSFEAKGCTNSEELSAILSKRVMIRRLKADVLKDLPDKRREVVYLSGSSIDQRMDNLKKAKAAFEGLKVSDAVNNKDSQAHTKLIAYYSETGIVKAAAVCEHILDNYFHPDSPSRKVLIFAHHQIVLDTIQVEVHKKQLKCIRIDGSTPAKDRGDLCKSFQEDPDVMVAILSITAAGVGITLTAANVVVFAELHWNPGFLLQCEDRAHRVGQKDCVFVQYLVAKNTADDAIWPMIQSKMDVLGLVNLSSDTFRDADRSHFTVEAPAPKRNRLS